MCAEQQHKPQARGTYHILGGYQGHHRVTVKALIEHLLYATHGTKDRRALKYFFNNTYYVPGTAQGQSNNKYEFAALIPGARAMPVNSSKSPMLSAPTVCKA